MKYKYRVPDIADKTVFGFNGSFGRDEPLRLVEESADYFWTDHGGHTCKWPLRIDLMTEDLGETIGSYLVKIGSEPISREYAPTFYAEKIEEQPCDTE